MRRRDVLKYVGASTTVGVTGCLGETEGNEPGNGNDGNQTDGDDDSSDGTDNNGDGTTVTGTSFSVSSRRGEDAEESASFWFEDGTLNVRGTIVGSDACKTAELESAEYDDERGALVVSVGTVDAEDAGDSCAEVLTSIQYEAAVEFDGEQPSVVVTHDGEEVEAEQGEPDENGQEGESRTSLTGTEFQVVDSECGEEKNEAEYTASQAMSEGNESEGIVEGTLSGPDGCTTAELGYASYDAEEGTLVADVRTASTDEDACADCITEVNYRLEANFENGVADGAAVSHDCVRVDALERGGVEDAEFSIEGIESASGNPTSPDAEFEEEMERIFITGTVRGNNGCAVARLAEAYVEDGRLVVDVETVSNGGEMCTQQLVAIRYTATISFEGEIPNEISVSHDGESIMGAAYESNSVSAEPSE
jgi:hypothetical protein